MTRTEDRLADALRAAARDGQEVRLRPLTVPARTRRQWIRRLAPAAAAAAVALVVTTSVLLTGGQRQPSAGQAGPPRFYVVAEFTQGFVVRSTATGAITDRIAQPGSVLNTVGIAAGGSDREFIVEYTRSTSSTQLLLYSFRLTGTGRVTGFHPVKNGTISGLPYLHAGLAVSPDGSSVAVPVACQTPGCSSSQIVVINLRTGARQVWQGGLQRRGFYLAIPSISWASSTSLVFLAQWSNDASLTGPYRTDEQVRTLDLTAGGGSLAQGHALLGNSARYPDIAQALINPGDTAITIEVPLPLQHGRVEQKFQLISVPLNGSGQSRLIYQGLLFGDPYASLQFDASGRHLLVVARTAHGNGWIDHGQLHLLPPQWAAALTDAW